jgi:hypothetical protein
MSGTSARLLTFESKVNKASRLTTDRCSTERIEGVTGLALALMLSFSREAGGHVSFRVGLI